MKNIILFLFSLPVIFVSCGKKGSSTIPEKRNLVQAVYASGKIFPENGYKVQTKLPGYIEKIHVKVGDSVKVGQAVLTIKSEVSELNVNAAKNLYDLAQKNASENAPLLTALRNDVASSKSKYELDSANYYRFVNLYKDNATSKMQVDAAKTQFEISAQNYQKAFNAYMNTRDRVKTELENARIQYDAQLSNKNDYTLLSTVNGMVYDIVPKEGELVGTQSPLVEIGEIGKYYIELSVDETDVGLIKTGQEVVYTIDAFRDQTFKGIVKEIFPRISQLNKTSKVVATIELESGVTIFSGMSVEANIIIVRKENALVIPREFLFQSTKVITGQNDTLEVKKGAEDLQYVEIISGIDAGTELIKP